MIESQYYLSIVLHLSLFSNKCYYNVYIIGNGGIVNGQKDWALDRGGAYPVHGRLLFDYLGVRLHGKDWTKIVCYVPTRTGTQIRSHAQKFFNKL